VSQFHSSQAGSKPAMRLSISFNEGEEVFAKYFPAVFRERIPSKNGKSAIVRLFIPNDGTFVRSYARIENDYEFRSWENSRFIFSEEAFYGTTYIIDRDRHLDTYIMHSHEEGISVAILQIAGADIFCSQYPARVTPQGRIELQSDVSGRTGDMLQSFMNMCPLQERREVTREEVRCAAEAAIEAAFAELAVCAVR
jgi:hypothetical protein